VALGHGAGSFPVSRFAGSQQGGEVMDDLVGLGADLGPFARSVASGPARRLLVGVGVPPALARLVLVLGGIEVLEHLALVHLGSFLVGGERRVQRPIWS
jgi:hypothetical protein